MNIQNYKYRLLGLVLLLIIVAAAVYVIEQTPKKTSAITTSTPAPINSGNISFQLDAGMPVSCGITCRETTARITNTGIQTAHNVCVMLQVYNSNGDPINVNVVPGNPTCVGDIQTGQSKSQLVRIDVDCGALYLKCSARPLTLKAIATCDEGIFEFPSQQFS